MKRICSECGKEIKDDTYDFSKDNKGMLALCIGCWNKQQGKRIMDAEKSVKLMKVIKEILPEHFNFDFGKPEIDEVIKRLQMWEDFKKLYGYKGLFWEVQAGLPKNVSEAMDWFEEKYFPKPKIRNVIEVDILASSHDVIDELAKEIEDMNGRIFNKGKIRVVSTRWTK